MTTSEPGNGFTQKEMLRHIWDEVRTTRDTVVRLERQVTGHINEGDAHDIPEVKEGLKAKGGAVRTLGISVASSLLTALMLAGLFAGRVS